MEKYKSIKDAIESISAALIRIDVSGADFKIAKNEFEKVKSEKDLISILTGHRLVDEEIDWDTFKKRLLDFQGEYGFDWKRDQGQFGTLRLTEVCIPIGVGEEMASDLMLSRTKEGDFRTSLKTYLPKLYFYLNKPNSQIIKLDIQQAREGFSQKVIDNQKYKFTTRGYEYSIGIDKFSFRSHDRKPEYNLGNLILNELRKLLELSGIYHQQQKRRNAKFQNVDFEGYKIIKKLSRDDFEVYNFELKPSNSIEAVSDAISQAVNYKSIANRTYIVIPYFDHRNFHDANRFRYFVQLCEENGLGAVSVRINPNDHTELLGLDRIIEAPWRELVDHSRANELMRGYGKEGDIEREFCPLCQRVVNPKNRQEDCGWAIPMDGNEEPRRECMKQLMERKMLE